MSHIVKCVVKMRSLDALNAAIDKLGLERVGGREPERHQLYGGSQQHGIGIKLQGWNFPVVVSTETGEATYDNYGGRWGAQEMLDGLVQEYAAQETTMQALEHGYCVESDVEEENGDRRLTLVNYGE